MLKTRVIPALLLRGQGLVKTTKFRDPKYVGDPINAVRIFNDKEVDELALLDITATPEGRKPNFKMIREIAGECFMPLSYGGGLNDIDDLRALFGLGVEKAIINTHAVEHPEFVLKASKIFGASSIVVSIDAKLTGKREYRIHTRGGRIPTKLSPVDHARRMEDMGAGEILLNSIDRDGTQAGFDLDLIRNVTAAVNIPVIACGGAGKLQDFAAAVREGGASAVAAGSLFVYYGRHRAVLISYPSVEELERLFTP
jgi:cyclase